MSGALYFECKISFCICRE